MPRSRDGCEDVKTAEPKSNGRTRGTRAGAMEVHIEELVLHGFNAGDRLSIGDAVEQELTRLLAEEHGLSGLSGPMSIERINGGAFKVAPGGRPAGVGAGVARAVHGAIGGRG
jgi:hypothetical protein